MATSATIGAGMSRVTSPTAPRWIPPGKPRTNGSDAPEALERRSKHSRGGRVDCNGAAAGDSSRTPLLYLGTPAATSLWALNVGANWEPVWLLNLRSQPTARVRIGRGDAQPVASTQATGAERDALWTKLNENFDYNAYQDKVTRLLTVVALKPERQLA